MHVTSFAAAHDVRKCRWWHVNEVGQPDRAQNVLDRTRALPSQATQKLLLTSDGTFRGVGKNYEVADGICISVVYPDD